MSLNIWCAMSLNSLRNHICSFLHYLNMRNRRQTELNTWMLNQYRTWLQLISCGSTFVILDSPVLSLSCMAKCSLLQQTINQETLNQNHWLRSIRLWSAKINKAFLNPTSADVTTATLLFYFPSSSIFVSLCFSLWGWWLVRHA